jgi:hypothetical protein
LDLREREFGARAAGVLGEALERAQVGDFRLIVELVGSRALTEIGDDVDRVRRDASAQTRAAEHRRDRLVQRALFEHHADGFENAVTLEPGDGARSALADVFEDRLDARALRLQRAQHFAVRVAQAQLVAAESARRRQGEEHSGNHGFSSRRTSA